MALRQSISTAAMVNPSLKICFIQEFSRFSGIKIFATKNTFRKK